MRVLVTGGAGYIGCCVVEELLQEGHDVVVFDSFLWGRDALAPLADRVKLVEGDIRSARDIAYALQDRIDAVVHLAGIVGDPACRKNPIAHFSTNVQAVQTLVDCMTDKELTPVRDLFYASSCSVYGNVYGLYEQVDEMTPVAPLSAYADGKLRAEKIIFAKATEHPNFHPTILRLTTLFGWSPRPRLDLVTNFFVYKALTEGKMQVFGGGSQYRSLVHVRDVATAFVHALNAPRFVRDRRIFHVGDEKNNRSVLEIAKTVRGVLPETEIIQSEAGPADRRDYKINCQRIRNVLNWYATFDVEDGIRDLVDNIRAAGLEWMAENTSNTAYDYV